MDVESLHKILKNFKLTIANAALMKLTMITYLYKTFYLAKNGV